MVRVVWNPMHVPWECEWHIQVRARGWECCKKIGKMDRFIPPHAKMEDFQPSEAWTEQRENGGMLHKQSSMECGKTTCHCTSERRAKLHNAYSQVQVAMAQGYVKKMFTCISVFDLSNEGCIARRLRKEFRKRAKDELV